MHHRLIGTCEHLCRIQRVFKRKHLGRTRTNIASVQLFPDIVDLTSFAAMSWDRTQAKTNAGGGKN